MKFTEEQRVRHHVNYARRIGRPATLTLIEWEQTLSDFNGMCAYCQSRPYELLEHFIAVEIAGTHDGNCVPACTLCNQIKGHRTGKSLSRLLGEATVARVQQYLESRSSLPMIIPSEDGGGKFSRVNGGGINPNEII